MTHLHSDVLPASTIEQPKLSLPRGQRIVRRPVKALLGVVLIGSVVGIGGLIVGRSAAPGLDQNAQASPATAQSGSVAERPYQHGPLAGYAPVEVWRATEAGAYGPDVPGAVAGLADPALTAQFERGEDIIPPNAATLDRESELIPESPEYHRPAQAASAGAPSITMSAEEGRLIGLAAVADIQLKALREAGCGPVDPECVPSAGSAATPSGPSHPADPGFSSTDDGFGHPANGFLNRDGEPYHWIP